ncbi:hypothetical protein FI667_g16256, partial [Globisporangium splendens]
MEGGEADYQKDIDALERILFRLASVTDERMLEVLQSLLPQLLKLFPSEMSAPLAVQLKDKVVSHVKTRLQALLHPKLPIQALGELLQETNLSVFTHNFAFMFIEIGFVAASQEERGHVLAAIFKALAAYTTSQQEIFFRLLIRALPITGNAVYPPPPARDVLPAPAATSVSTTETSNGDSEASESSKEEIDPSVVGNMEVLLDFLLDFLLYEPPSPSTSSAGINETTVFGLMTPRLERIQRIVKTAEFNKERLYETQMNALKFVRELEIPSKHKYVHYIAGCASYHHTIKSFCEEQLVRVMKHEYEQLEDSQTMRRIIAMILGSQVAQGSGAFTGYELLALSNRNRLGDASILQALTLLSESKAATNVMPMMLQLLCHLMYGNETARPQNIANRVKLAGIRLCHWTFVHCEMSFIEHFLGPVIFPTLLRVLMDPNADNDGSQLSFMREFRQGIYETLTVLGTRVPSIVAASEQAFQVLLVRCLVEEEHRTGTGANALKALTAFSAVYSMRASRETQMKVRSELIGLLDSMKIFDSTKNYERVRAAIATWCADLLGDNTSDNNIELRFALLKLCADQNEEVRTLASKALYTDPLPTLSAVSKYLSASFPQRDLKKSIREARNVESCLRFCLRVVAKSQECGEMEIDDDRGVMIEYFVQTLLGKSEAAVVGDTSALSAMYQAAAASLVEMYAFDKRALTTVLGESVSQLLEVARLSPDRDFLQDIGLLVRYTVGATKFSTERAVNEVVQAISCKFDDASVPPSELSQLLYVLGSAISTLERSEKELSDTQMEILTSSFGKMVALLATAIKTSSNFAMFPRGEEDQNSRINFLRSVLDGVGLTGSLTRFLRDERCSSDWIKLKRASLSEIQKVIEWNLGGISSDGSLKLKLTNLKHVALESLSQAVSGLPPTVGSLSDLTSGLEDALNAILNLGSEQDPELQLLIGETLVFFGTHEFPASSAVPVPEAAFANNRAAAIFSRILTEFAESRQPNVRRSATIWLLCICAAGLSSEDTTTDPSTWQLVLGDKAFTSSLVETHEFFVTMLNDSNNIAKESAVKGLAYLRLRALNMELGDQFSDSLFRRLRCFRAFATTIDSATGQEADNADTDASTPDNEAAAAAARVAAAAARGFNPSPASTTIGTTVENAAYREVSNLAADIGDPELMYALLYLSTTDPIWQSLLDSPSSGNAANKSKVFSFVKVDRAFRLSIIEKAGKLWMGEGYSNTNKLVPWLYLLKFHSNSKVAEVMNNLWNFAKGKFVTTNSQEKTLLQQHWHVIFKFLLSRLETSRNFKYREAACVALVDLLNGADAAQLRDEFLHLWKLSSAAVDDVMEAVCVVGLKLYRYMGELSLRIAASDEPCRKILLQFLIAEGIVSKNMVCRALGIDILLRLVKSLEAVSIQDSLATLILKLLEYLSSLEMPELQYAQFHVEKKDQLERLRVSISQSGPVGQLLELSTTRLKELAGTDTCVKIVDELSRGVANVLKFGVGLNTRVGTANFAATLAVELPFELRKCKGAELLLTKVFIPFVGNKTSAENDTYGDEESRYGAASGGLADGLVVQSYCRAAAYLCPLVDASLVREYVRSGIFAFNKTKRTNGMNISSGGADEANGSSATLFQSDANRFLLITAIATKELVVKVPPIADASTMVQADNRNDWYCTHVFPGAFIGQFASTELLKNTWIAVLEELPPSVLYAEASIDATLASIALFIAHSAWDSRKQAALALHALFSSPTSSYRSRMTSEQTDRIWTNLVDAVPGRLWKGKGVLLEALVALTSVKQDTRVFLSKLLMEECDRAWKNKDMEYLESSIVSFGTLSSQMPSSQWELRLTNFVSLRRALHGWLDGRKQGGTIGIPEDGGGDESMDVGFALPPLMIKCIFESLALIWPGQITGPASEIVATSTEAISWLCACIARVDFNVWSIRKAVFEALASVVASAPSKSLQQTMLQVVERCCSEDGVRDAKYSMIRVAAGAVLVALTRRQDDHDLALQLTVQKERIAETIEVLKTSNEPAEQRAAFQTMTNLLQLN